MKRVALVLICVAGLMLSLPCLAEETATEASVPAQLAAPAAAPLPSWLAPQGGQAPRSQAIASPEAGSPFGPPALSQCMVVCASCAAHGQVCCHLTPSLCTCVDPGGTCFPQ